MQLTKNSASNNYAVGNNSGNNKNNSGGKKSVDKSNKGDSARAPKKQTKSKDSVKKKVPVKTQQSHK